MEVIFYTVSNDANHLSPLSPNIFNCHICKHRHSSYPEVEAHYLTQHSNVIIVLTEGGKTTIRRHFVGPKSKRPSHWVERVNSRAAAKRQKLKPLRPISTPPPDSLPLQISPLLEPKAEPLEEQIHGGDDDLTLTNDWDFENLMIPEPSEDILSLLHCPELNHEFEIPLDFDLQEIAWQLEDANADTSDEKMRREVLENGQEPPSCTPTKETVEPDMDYTNIDELIPLTTLKRKLGASTEDLDNIDELTLTPLTPIKGKLEGNLEDLYAVDDLETGDEELDDVLEFALHLEEESATGILDSHEHSR